MTASLASGPRWQLIRRLIGPDADSLLDIGCRDKALRGYLPGDSRYVGLDLGPPADVISSAEDPLPFADNEFSCAVLADVLEHLNHPHAALEEAIRVASRSVVVLLPNVYALHLRLKFLTGRTMGKYEFGASRSVDRHRWLLNFEQAAAFTDACARNRGWRVAEEYGYDGNFRRPWVRAAYRVARTVAGPNLWAWEYAARLEPDGQV